MTEHFATIRWQRGADAFARGRYSRRHQWTFDGGAAIAASASPHVVPAPWSDPAAVDPEEAYVAALSSCHMLWFLSLAAAQGFVVDGYEDAAVGYMRETAPQRIVVSDVVLRPRITFDPTHAATPEQIHALHRAAHERCFLANSVKTEVRVEQR